MSRKLPRRVRYGREALQRAHGLQDLTRLRLAVQGIEPARVQLVRPVRHASGHAPPLAGDLGWRREGHRLASDSRSHHAHRELGRGADGVSIRHRLRRGGGVHPPRFTTSGFSAGS